MEVSLQVSYIYVLEFKIRAWTSRHFGVEYVPQATIQASHIVAGSQLSYLNRQRIPLQEGDEDDEDHVDDYSS